MIKGENITGQKFGRLTAIKFIDSTRDYRYKWECLCECGNKTIVSKSKLKNKWTQSCGCLQKDRAREGQKTHGLSRTKFIKRWEGLNSRCNNPNNPRWRQYGGRGIKVMWNSFEEFRDDMYESYLEHVKIHGERNTTIDRIDSNGNYSKENCRWATQKIQQRNRRNNRILTYKGETKVLVEWAEEYGISIYTLWARLNSGLSVEDALTKPLVGVNYK